MERTIECSLSDIRFGTSVVLEGRVRPDRYFEALGQLTDRRRAGENLRLESLLESADPTMVLLEDKRASEPAPSPSFARYRNPREIGRGGMGVILRAEDPTLGRDIALKVIGQEAQADGYTARKFLQEARITGSLEHPNIVPVHELGMTGDRRPYFAMKLVKGVSLDQVLAKGTARSRALRDFTKICDAVAFAHSRGVIHRDLKPQNIMVGEFGEVMVMDWGLARVEGETEVPREGSCFDAPGEVSRTTDGTVMGTPAYMPPEQARGEIDRIDRRSDVYSLGAILYEILTGVPPYPGGSPWEVLKSAAAGKPVPPSERATVPRELEAVVLKAMDPNPDVRYSEAHELKADVEAYLDGRILSAARYNFAQRATKWMRRHRTASVSTASVLLVAALLLGALRWDTARKEIRREKELRTEVQVGWQLLHTARNEFAAIESIPLREPNGERRDDRVDHWFSTLEAAVAHYEALVTKVKSLWPRTVAGVPPLKNSTPPGETCAGRPGPALRKPGFLLSRRRGSAGHAPRG